MSLTAPPESLTTILPRTRRLTRLLPVSGCSRYWCCWPPESSTCRGTLCQHRGTPTSRRQKCRSACRFPGLVRGAGRGNQQVTAGQPCSAGSRTFPGGYRQAETNLAQVPLTSPPCKASYREKQAEIGLAQARSPFAPRTSGSRPIYGPNFISASPARPVQPEYRSGRAETSVQEADLKRIAQTLGGGVDTRSSSNPPTAPRWPELEQPKLELTWSEVRASLPASSANRFKPGQYETGSTAMPLVVAKRSD